jgi:SAM-dependent methyltransferase
MDKMRRTRILVVPSDPTFATDYYRATGPFSKLDVEMVQPKGGTFSWTTVADIDIVFIQRPAVPFNVHLIEIAKRCKKPVLLDYDDNPFELNEENPVYDIWNRDHVRASIKESLRLADIIMTSTQDLKDALLEQVPTANIRVVPNAVDDSMFSLEPYNGPRTKTILLRGAGSHSVDWGMYKEGILQILREFPEYKLAIMGLHPMWITDIPENQLKAYPFTDLATYFETLTQIRPEIAIVPLADNKFNRAKSAIGLYEGVIAGAAVLGSNLPEFSESGACLFSNSEELVLMARDIINDKDIHQYYYEMQLEGLPRLSNTNELRKDIIEELLSVDRKYKPYSIPDKVATDLEFHEYALSHAHTQDDQDYDKLHKNFADWVVKNINPKSALELGCGTGATLYHLLKNDVNAYGIEINPYSYQYFIDRYPTYQHQIVLGDLTKEPLELDTIGDLVYSLEVFEHITMPEEWWIKYLTDLSKKFRNFYFSSTPYADKDHFDRFWGHRNIRKVSSWVKLFEQSGWTFKSNPKAIVSWDLWFTSNNC